MANHGKPCEEPQIFLYAPFQTEKETSIKKTVPYFYLFIFSSIDYPWAPATTLTSVNVDRPGTACGIHEEFPSSAEGKIAKNAAARKNIWNPRGEYSKERGQTPVQVTSPTDI